MCDRNHSTLPWWPLLLGLRRCRPYVVRRKSCMPIRGRRSGCHGNRRIVWLHCHCIQVNHFPFLSTFENLTTDFLKILKPCSVMLKPSPYSSHQVKPIYVTHSNNVFMAHQRSCGKVMFSLLLSFCWQWERGSGLPRDHYPWTIRPHYADPTLVSSGGHYWRPV